VRVATYTQPTVVTRGSLAALSILVVTILFGTTVATTLAGQFAPALAGLATFVWTGLYALAFLGLMFGQGVNWISWLVRYRILFVLLLIGAVLSVAWSVDSRVSAERVVHMLGGSLLGIYFGFTVPLLTMLRVLGVVLGGIMLASVAAALALPELGIIAYEGQLVWSGVMNSKNHLGFWAATGVLLYVALSDSTRSVPLRLLCYLMAGVCLALLAFSHSATSLLAMLVGGALSTYLFIANRFQLGFVRMAVLAVLFAALVGFAAANIDTAELVGRSDDLTGRGEVWSQTWKLVMARPLGGYGYGALWFPTDETLWIQQSLTDFTWVVHHAHNGFLQVASEIGLPLALIALLMVAQQMVEIVYCQYQRQQVGTLFVLAFVVAFLIGNFSEARFLVTRELYWVLFVALPISMLRQVNLVSSEETDERDGEFGAAAPDGVDPFGPGHGPATVRSAGPALGHAAPGAASALVPFAAAGGGAMAGEPWHVSSGGEPPGGVAGTKSVYGRSGWRGSSGETAHDLADDPAARTDRPDEEEGWESATLDDIGGELDAEATADIDLGDSSLDDAPDEFDRDATQVLTPEDWIAGTGRDRDVHDELPADRFDKDFDVTGDDTDGWENLPLGGAKR